jgi:Tfp pilus assembly protein PilN
MSQQINLFNPIFLKQKKYFSAMAMAQALGMLAIGAALVIVYASFQASSLNKEAVASTAQLEAVKAQLAKVKSEYGPRQKSASLEQEVKQAETEMLSLRQVFDILQRGDFGNTKGYSGYLRAFSRQIIDGLWLTGIDIVGAGNELAVQGRALQPALVPAYMNNLKREPIMQGKSFATLEMQDQQDKQADKAGATDTAGVTGAKQPVVSAGYIEFRLH